MGKQVDAKNEHPSYLVSTREQVGDICTRWKEEAENPAFIGIFVNSWFSHFLHFSDTVQLHTQPGEPIFGLKRGKNGGIVWLKSQKTIFEVKIIVVVWIIERIKNDFFELEMTFTGFDFRHYTLNLCIDTSFFIL